MDSTLADEQCPAALRLDHDDTLDITGSSREYAESARAAGDPRKKQRLDALARYWREVAERARERARGSRL